MKKDDIAENVLKHGKEGVKQNIIEALDEFFDDFADEMWEAAEEIITLRKENAVLCERLGKAIELPFFQKNGEVIVIIYKEKHGIVCEEKYIEDEFYEGIRGLEAAEARFAELKGGEK